MTRSPVSFPFLVLSTVALARPAGAAAPEGPGDVAVAHYEGDMVPLPDRIRVSVDPGPPPGAKQGVIFVNFDGATLSGGDDDSRANRSLMFQGNFPAYGQGSKREAVMQAVRQDWAPFNVIVTDSRPASGDYTMNMTGPLNFVGPGVLGVALVDCNDAWTHNNVTFAFHSANDPFSASTQATTIGQEVAHSYGLEHVDEPGDIMNPQNAGGDPSFRDECIPIVPGNNGIACGQQHAAQCGTGSKQNSYRELLALFGPAVPDEAPPTVAIVAPSDGAVFEVGADFDIVAEASDDQGIDGVDLYVDGVFQQTDGQAPYGWGVENIPAGTYAIHAVARDLAGNEATSETITIYVGEAPPPDGGDSGSGSDSGGGTDGGGSTGGDPYEPGDTGSLPTDFGMDRADGGGCGCAAGSPAPGWSLLLLPALVPAGRRRRRP